MIMKGNFIPRKRIGAFGIHYIYGFTVRLRLRVYKNLTTIRKYSL